ncbi:MAG: beta-N-acetylhexosaminidase [Gammaproteobacteria bacterium]|nr:beta-N-acetylhexosaminidase [Gammaproteobacteria bacterium]MDH4310446.1 beta-N-acetylhexosaminidase [Gammaproteobacteria bacterium]
MTLGPLMVDVAGCELTEEDRRVLAHPLVGAVILFTRNFASYEQLAALVRDVRAVRNPPLLVAVDHEGGRVQRFRHEFTVLPPQRAIGHAYDLDPEGGRRLAWQCGWLLAAELRSIGIDLSFAPCIDLDYGVSEVIGDRAYHRDPEVVSRLAVACMQGMRTAGMAATAKHFPGHGAVVADSHKALPIDRRPLTELTDELLPYRRMIANGLTSVMVAHVLFPEVDEAPAGFSARWIQQELRWGLGFTGAVFSDDLSMGGAAFAGTVPERARRAIEAGCDLLPICNDRPAVLATLAELEGAADPLSQVRLVRLHGRPMPARDQLRKTAQWAECQRAIDHCRDTPSLQLNA